MKAKNYQNYERENDVSQIPPPLVEITFVKKHLRNSHFNVLVDLDWMQYLFCYFGRKYLWNYLVFSKVLLGKFLML